MQHTPTKQAISLTVNGKDVSAAAMDGATLLELLRDELGITSPKDGCSPTGQCGCCTVLLDGRPVTACTTSAEKAAGRTVTTLEGVAVGEREVFAKAFASNGG
ncbi:MAG: (2Fe-2S)-binding protein, partial [Rhodanobacteraceae bacterium]